MGKCLLHICTNLVEILIPDTRLSHLLSVSRFELLLDPSAYLNGLTWRTIFPP